MLSSNKKNKLASDSQVFSFGSALMTAFKLQCMAADFSYKDAFAADFLTWLLLLMILHIGLLSLLIVQYGSFFLLTLQYDDFFCWFYNMVAFATYFAILIIFCWFHNRASFAADFTLSSTCHHNHTQTNQYINLRPDCLVKTKFFYYKKI